MPSQLMIGLQEIRRHSGWFLALGILQVGLGLAAVAYSQIATAFSVLYMGWMLLFTGVAQFALAFQVRNWSGFFLHCLAGVVEILVGIMVIDNPMMAAAGLTLVIALYLLVGGIFRMVSALVLGFQGAWWVALSGLITFLLGLALWRQWPYSAPWFIGTCVGIDLLIHGSAWIAFAMKVPSRIAPAPEKK